MQHARGTDGELEAVLEGDIDTDGDTEIYNIHGHTQTRLETHTSKPQKTEMTLSQRAHTD